MLFPSLTSKLLPILIIVCISNPCFCYSQAYKEVKKEKPPFVPPDDEEKERQEAELKKKKAEVVIDENLKCIVCKNLLQDAVLTPCCAESYCDECNCSFDDPCCRLHSFPLEAFPPLSLSLSPSNCPPVLLV